MLLPLELGVNLEQVVLVLGRSKGATCTMRTRFMAQHKYPGSAPRSKRQLRNRAKASLQQEEQLLDEVLSEAAQGGVVVVPPIKPLLEKKLGKSLSLTTVYNMLHRHGWHKKPMRPVVKAMLTHEYTYAYGAVSPMDGKFDSLVLPQVNGQWMQVFLDEMPQRYSTENIITVLDGAGWHRSRDIKLPENMRLHFLPPYRCLTTSLRSSLYVTNVNKRVFQS